MNQKKRLASGLRPDPLGELKRSPDTGSEREEGREGGRWENIFKISLPETKFFRPNKRKKIGGRTRPDKLGEIKRSPDQGSERERRQEVREMGNIFKT